MKPTRLALPILSLIAVLAVSVPCPADVVLAPHSTVAGQTLEQWSAVWWQWALGIPAANNPLTDPTGANAGIGNSGPVFFLGGTTGGSAVRSFSVPGGVFLFFPLVDIEDTNDGTVASMQAGLAAFLAGTSELHASIDGVPVPNLFDHRETAPVFSFTAPPGALFGLAPGVYDPAVADGYYLMLAPMSAGTHVINFGGTVGGFSVDVTDTILVTPEPGTLLLLSGGLAGIAGRLRRRRL